MGAGTSHHEPLDRVAVRASKRCEKAFTRSFRDKSVKRSPRRMDRLRRSFRDSFRKRKEHVPESSKPHQWQSDEIGVRNGTCSFHVKYLGCVEVFESRGMQVCEEALKVLRGNTRRRPVKAVLYVSGDGLRVVEDETKGLIVDQTIEKVSFCAPDRNHEKGFSYICRDGTTRRWMCHGFLALRESGERLSHAVGCAFASCLERKQRRDKECGVTMTFDSTNSTFTRSGSFRHTTLTERIQDPQQIKPGLPPPPVKAAFNPYAIERPHATDMMLQRQGSFRGFQQVPGASPFKRQLSLRISELPSNLARQRSLSLEGNNDTRTPSVLNKFQVSPIPEVVQQDPVSAMCQQLQQGLSMLTSNDLEKSIPEHTASPNDSFTKKLDALSFPVVEPISGVAPAALPRPDQWLGTVVAHTKPAAPSPTPRRTPPLAHLRALSLGSESFFPNQQVNGTLSDSANSLGSNSSSGIGTTSGTVSLNSGSFNSAAPSTASAVATTLNTSSFPNAPVCTVAPFNSSPFPAVSTAATMPAPAVSSSGAPKDPFDAEWVVPQANTNPFLPPATVKAFEVRL